MNTKGDGFGLCQPARYRIEVAGHLDKNRAIWFSELSIASSYDEAGSPVTIMTGEILDQPMLHGLLTRIRDLGLPLISINRV